MSDVVECFEVPGYSFCLLNYSDFLREVEIKIINDLNKFDLLDNLSLQKHDVKKIFYHHIIRDACDLVINNKLKNKPVLYYNPIDVDLELFKYSSKYKILSFIKTITNKLRRLLPLKIYQSAEPLKLFIDNCKITGELRSRANMIHEYISRHEGHKYTFSSVKTFAKRYDLTYLSETYFHNIKTKNLMFL